LVDVFTIAEELIINDPHALALVECDGATVYDRVAIVFRNHLVKIITRFPLQHTWLRFIPDHKRSIDADRVLFEPVDLYCRMIRGRTKLVSLLEVSGIDVCSGIDDDRAPTRRDFNTQHIVVPVRSTAIDPYAASVEAEIQIAVAHDVSSRFG